MDGQHVGGDKSGRDTVDPTKIHPLDGQTPSQLHHTGLGGIIRRLLLGDIDQDGTDGGGEDERPGPSVTLLFLKNPARRLGRPKRPVEVDLHDLPPPFHRVLLGRMMRRDPRVGHHHVQRPEILHHPPQRALHRRGVFDFRPVRRTGDVIRPCDFRRHPLRIPA